MLGAAVKHVPHREVGPAASEAQVQGGYFSTELKTNAVEIIQVLREQQGPAPAQYSGLETVEVWDVDEEAATRLRAIRDRFS